MVNGSRLTNFSIRTNWYFHEVPIWAEYVSVIYLAIIFISALFGNCLIILVHVKTNSKTSTDYFLFTMAVVELVCSTMNIPIHLMYCIKSFWAKIASSTFCRFASFVGSTTGLSSTCLLAAIALEQYFKICKPHWRSQTCGSGKKRSVFIILSCIAFSVPFSVGYHVDSHKACVKTLELKPFMLLYNRILAAVIVLLFSITTVACVLTMCSVTKRHRLRVHAEQSKLGRLGSTSNLAAQSDVASLYQVVAKPKLQNGDINFSNNGSTTSTTRPFVVATGSQVTVDKSSSSKAASTTNVNDSVNMLSPGIISTSFSDRLPSHLVAEKQSITRTTKILILRTLIYMVTYGISLSLFASEYKVFGKTANYWARSLILVNCATNPLLFICMSSKFRKTGRHIICLTSSCTRQRDPE